MPNAFSARLLSVAAFLAALLSTSFPAFAAGSTEGFGSVFRDQARQTNQFSKGRQAEFYSDTDARGYGAHVKGFITTSELASAGTTRDINQRDHLTTMMVSGTYDLPKKLDRTMPLHPFVTGGLGLAVYDGGQTVTADGSVNNGTRLVPVLRVGGGLAYKVSDKMDLAVSYKTGFTASSGDDRVNMQIAEIGMKMKF